MIINYTILSEKQELMTFIKLPSSKNWLFKTTIINNQQQRVSVYLTIIQNTSQGFPLLHFKTIKRYMSMGLLLMIYFVYVSQNDMFDLYKEFKAEYGLINIFQVCAHWDIQSHRWVETGNVLLHSNATHSTCHFTYLSTYAVIRSQVNK